MLAERVVRITVKPFMDMSTMIEERLTQCCVHVGTVNADSGAHQCAPFCAVQAWAPLAATRLSTATGRPQPAGGPPMSAVQQTSGDGTDAAAPYDPLRLCIFATIALFGWLLGPVALLLFAVLGLVGYTKARRRGLTNSKCFLRDVRLVLGYLGLLAAAGAMGTWVWIG